LELSGIKEASVKMPRYDYQAMTNSGSIINGTLEADSSADLISKLKGNGYYPMSVSEETTELKGRLGRRRLGGRVKSSDLEFFTYQLATLLNAGVPLIRSLSVASEQISSVNLKKAVDQVRYDVEHGSTFYDALGQHGKIFSDLYINIVRAGETGGVLGLVLERLVDFSEKQSKLKSAVIAALFYPAILILVGLGIGGVLMLFVIPRLSTMFAELGAALPWPTQVLMTSTMFLKKFWWVMILFIVAAFFSIRQYSRTEMGKYNIDRFKLKIPIVGAIFRTAALSRFARTLGTLLDNGVQILQSLAIVRETIGNRVYRDIVEKSERQVERGESLAASLQRSGKFPSIVTHMIAIGEESGDPQNMLMKLSDYYDNEMDKQLERVSSLIGPVIILIMAVAVGFLVAAAALPVLEASSMISV